MSPLSVYGALKERSGPLHRARHSENGRFVPDKVMKALRDRNRIREHARYLIILHKDGTTEVKYRKSYQLNVIAILAPAWIDDFSLPEALVLEIGVGRVTPYRIVEQVDKKPFLIQARKKVRTLSEEEIKILWPILEEVFFQITIDARSTWKTRESFWIADPDGHSYPIERGKRFRLHLEESFLTHLIISGDLEARKHIKNNARLIRLWLRRYKCNSYTAKQLRSFSQIRKAVDLWKNMRENLVWKLEVIRRLGNRRTLFLDALEAYELSNPVFEDIRTHPRKEFLERAVKRLRLTTPARSCFYVIREDGNRHGKGCMSFEHYIERSHRILNNL